MTSRETWAASAVSAFRNFRRAGRLKNRSRDFDERALGRADLAHATRPCRPRSGSRCRPARRAARVRSRNRETDAIDGSASPRNPSVLNRRRGPPPSRILLVACRSTRQLRVLARSCLRRRLRPTISFLPPNSIVIGDARGAGVDGVLDELLDDRRRPLDDLAGGDLVGELGRQPMDAVHSQSSRRNIHSMAPEITDHDADDPPELRRVRRPGSAAA